MSKWNDRKIIKFENYRVERVSGFPVVMVDVVWEPKQTKPEPPPVPTVWKQKPLFGDDT